MTSAIKTEGNGNFSRTLLRVLLYVVLGLFVLYYLAPLVIMITTAVKSMEEIRAGSILALPKSIELGTWAYAWNSACISVNCGGMRPYFWNSVSVVVPAVIISTFLGALNGYALTKWSFRGAHIIFAMMLFVCFIPYQPIILPLAQLLGKVGLANTTTGLALVYIIYGLGFTTLFFRNYFVSVPNELVKAAMIDGAGFFTIFWKIMVPISVPIFVVTIIWQFTQIWNDFLFAVSFMGGESQTMMVALNNLTQSSTGTKRYDVDMAAAMITALPTLLVYIFAGRYFVRGLTAGAVKG